jgi:hypothetical protein
MMRHMLIRKRGLGRRQAVLLCAACSACSALLTYMFDPERGRRRRHMARDRWMARTRRVVRVLGGMWRRSASDAYGMSHKIVHLVPRMTDVVDDETLRQRVESQLFRDRHVPKAEMNITAEHGTVILRGELDSPEDITRLETRVRHMPGVRGVHNLLHPRGTDAPNKERSRMATIF